MTNQHLNSLFRDVVLQYNGTIDHEVEGYGVIYASLPDVNIRVSDGRIEFGAKKTFMRWANSVDFVFHGYPRNEIGCCALIEAVQHCVANGFVNKRWGDEVDVYPWYRKYRQKIKTRIKKQEMMEANNAN